MLNFNSVLLFSDNPKALTDFYQKVFAVKPSWTDGGYTGWQVGTGHIVVGPHDKVKGKSACPERLLLNFETTDVNSEFNRLKALGATVIASPYHPGEEPDAWIATFADPDGNYFQLMTPMG